MQIATKPRNANVFGLFKQAATVLNVNGLDQWPKPEQNLKTFLPVLVPNSSGKCFHLVFHLDLIILH